MSETFAKRILLRLARGSRTEVLIESAIVIAVIALIDWRFDVNISFGFLYLLPMLMVGSRLERWQIAAVAALCTILLEAFDPFPWTATLGIPRVILSFAAFFGAGLYVFESARNRRLTERHMTDIETEIELRREAEEQLRVLIESSPAMIITVDANGKVLLANDAAHRLLGIEAGKLSGETITRYLPALSRVPLTTDETSFFRTAMECRGRRADGEFFLAQIWFSTYRTLSGPRLAAVVFDTSEGFRDREEFSLQQLLTGSRIVVSALCHEIRNICGAIAVVHTKLSLNTDLAANRDLTALRNLVDTLGNMAGIELQQRKLNAGSVDLRPVMEDLRIILEPAFREQDAVCRWDIPEEVPPVLADRQALLQAFLNISKNSLEALEGEASKELKISVAVDRESVVVRFTDTGRGLASPQGLFKPFQQDAHGTGLGLYLSRAFVRSFRGDIEYEPQPAGCCFAVVLTPASSYAQEERERHADNTPAAPGRPPVVPGESRQTAGHRS